MVDARYAVCPVGAGDGHFPADCLPAHVIIVTDIEIGAVEHNRRDAALRRPAVEKAAAKTGASAAGLRAEDRHVGYAVAGCGHDELFDFAFESRRKNEDARRILYAADGLKELPPRFLYAHFPAVVEKEIGPCPIHEQEGIAFLCRYGVAFVASFFRRRHADNLRVGHGGGKERVPLFDILGGICGGAEDDQFFAGAFIFGRLFETLHIFQKLVRVVGDQCFLYHKLRDLIIRKRAAHELCLHAAALLRFFSY